MHDIVLALSPIAGLTANCMMQISIAHLMRRTSSSIVSGALFGLLATCVVFVWAASGNRRGLADWFVAFVTYGALSFGYWNFLNLNSTSVRIRVIREMLHRRGGITRAELLAEYSGDEFLRRRLVRLEKSSKQLAFLSGRWVLRKSTLYRAAQVLGWFRNLLLPGYLEE